jgi:sigma-B regulation protein RsbU (phosphoserine phosphatase)
MMIGDAVGKGLRAAMFITEAHGLAHGAAIHQPTPDRILSAINSSIVSSRGPSSNFTTLLCGMLNHGEHRLLYSSAGHNPPVLLRRRTCRPMELGGLPIGIMADAEYPLLSEELGEGDLVVMYTDGVTEAVSPTGEQFGMERLMRLVEAHGHEPARELIDCILQSITDFAAGQDQADDITLLVLRRAGGAG